MPSDHTLLLKGVPIGNAPQTVLFLFFFLGESAVKLIVFHLAQSNPSGGIPIAAGFSFALAVHPPLIYFIFQLLMLLLGVLGHLALLRALFKTPASMRRKIIDFLLIVSFVANTTFNLVIIGPSYQQYSTLQSPFPSIEATNHIQLLNYVSFGILGWMTVLNFLAFQEFSRGTQEEKPKKQ